MRRTGRTTARRRPLFRHTDAAPLPRARGEAGQAIVEMALILPIVVLLMAIAFTGWDAMQQSIRLTTAARAATLQASHDLDVWIHTPANGLTCSTASSSSGWANETANTATSGLPWYDAKTAVNNEESSSSFQNTNSANDNYVNMTFSTDTVPPTSGVTMYLVTITVSHKVGAWLPFVPTQHVSATATGRYC